MMRPRQERVRVTRSCARHGGVLILLHCLFVLISIHVLRLSVLLCLSADKMRLLDSW